MGNVNLKINGLNVTAPAGSTILEAAQAAGIKIPTLCYLKEINVRRGSKRRKKSRGILCTSGCRRDGSADEYAETS